MHMTYRNTMVLVAVLLTGTTTACQHDATAQASTSRAARAADSGHRARSATLATTRSDTLQPDTLLSDMLAVAMHRRADTSSAASSATVSGTLEPQARALLRAELSGAVRMLSVKVGHRVTAGAVLATLDVPAVHSAMAAAEAQVVAQDALVRQVQRERERVVQLLAVGGVSTTEMEDWNSRVQAARAQRATAMANVARLTVRAPFDGIVERAATTQGSIVQMGDELLSIFDPRALELEAGLSVKQTQHARLGARVALRVAGFADSSVIARIVRVAPTLDPTTRQLRITVHVPNGAGRFPAGAWAEGTLVDDRTVAPATSRPTTRVPTRPAIRLTTEGR